MHVQSGGTGRTSRRGGRNGEGRAPGLNAEQTRGQHLGVCEEVAEGLGWTGARSRGVGSEAEGRTGRFYTGFNPTRPQLSVLQTSDRH